MYAGLVANDQRHRTAGDLLAALLRRHELVATSYVVAETFALLQARVGPAAALRFDEVLRPRILVIWVDAALHERAVARVRARGSRGLSLVDGASFAVMDELGLDAAFCYDEDFVTAGFRCLREIGDLAALG